MRAFAGTHVVADLYGVDAGLLGDVERLTTILREAVDAGGAQLLSIHAHGFAPHGVTVVAVLAESHASIHTWPEHGGAFVDAFTCGESDPGAIVRAVSARLGPTHADVRAIARGEPTLSHRD